MSGFYVATNGNDANGDGSQASPFATLGRAQTAMENSATKTTYVEGGTYTLSSSLNLGAKDSGVTFAAAPGQTAIINGNNALTTLVNVNGASGVTLSGLTFENSALSSSFPTGAVALTNAAGTSITNDHFVHSGSDAVLLVGSTSTTISGNLIENSVANGIEDKDGGKNNVFSNNRINGVATLETSGGGFFLHGTVNDTISNNLVENTQGSGISVQAIGGYNNGTLYAQNSGTLINQNIVRNTNLNSSDSGAIYVIDRTGQDTGIKITNNEVDGAKSSDPNGHIIGIYLDDYASGVTVSGNIVRGVEANDIQVHGGRNDTITNNILDVSGGTPAAVLFQSAPSDVTPNPGAQSATNDIFSKNILYTSGGALNAYVNLGQTPAPSISSNLYYDANGPVDSTGDSAAKSGDPAFANAAGNNYALQAGSAAGQIGFVAINQAAIGPSGSAVISDPAPVTPMPVISTPSPVSVGSGSSAIVLNVSEDAYLGDAQFTVSVDGQQVGGTLTATANHSQGQSQAFTLNGNFANQAHTVAVNFLNDAYGGTAATDRNLYIDSASYNGVTTSLKNEQASAGSQNYAIPVGNAPVVVAPTPAPVTPTPVTPTPTPVTSTPSPVNVGTGSSAIVLNVSEDAYLGDAQFTVSVDGQQVGGILTTTANHTQGQSQAFTLNGNFANQAHTVAVNFLNDAYAGTAATDRNLYVDSASYNGVTTSIKTAQNSAGSQDYVVPAGNVPVVVAPTPVPTPVPPAPTPVAPAPAPSPVSDSGTGATIVTGTSGNDVLEAVAGNSTLIGNGGVDTYRALYNNNTFTTVINGAGQTNNSLGILSINSTHDHLWFTQKNNDLAVQILGTSKQAVIKDWYIKNGAGNYPNQVQSITAGLDGTHIDGNLQQLVQAMATFSAANSAFSPEKTEHATLTDSFFNGVVTSAAANAWHG